MVRTGTVILLLVTGVLGFAQTSFDAGSSKAPRAVFESLAPYYDYMDKSLKPWHLKVAYQFGDEGEHAGERGVFEYWWVSPSVYRSTWTRGNAVHSDWHTADGRHFIQTKGEPLSLYEYWLQRAYVSPLPAASELKPEKSILVDHVLSSQGSHSRCIMIVPSPFDESAAKALPFGLYPEYCVNKASPLLLGFYKFGTLMVRCVDFVVSMQGKSMPREIDFVQDAHVKLQATAEPVDTISPSDPALLPSPDAVQVKVEKTSISEAVAAGLLTKRATPVYPEDAKNSKVQGKVVMEVAISPEGQVEDVQLVSSPMPSMVPPAFLAVSQWRFKPYVMAGQPVTAVATMSVDFSLGK